MIRPESGCAQGNFAQLAKNEVLHLGEKPNQPNRSVTSIKEHAGTRHYRDVIVHLNHLSFEINKKTVNSTTSIQVRFSENSKSEFGQGR